jgi:hypothetical protein
VVAGQPNVFQLTVAPATGRWLTTLVAGAPNTSVPARLTIKGTYILSTSGNRGALDANGDGLPGGQLDFFFKCFRHVPRITIRPGGWSICSRRYLPVSAPILSSSLRAVWSFWTKPFLAHRTKIWRSPEHHFQSWVLSFLTAQLHYPETALYTDDLGAELLVDRLGLPFNYVSTALNDLADVDEGWWAAGKLLAYSRQTAPFVHIDSDAYLWSPFHRAWRRRPSLLKTRSELSWDDRATTRPHLRMPCIVPKEPGYRPNGNGIGVKACVSLLFAAASWAAPIQTFYATTPASPFS